MVSGQDYLDAADILARERSLDPWSALMRVLLDSLRSLRLPAELAPLLAQAELYWAGGAVDLLQVKCSVWDLVNSRYPRDSEMPSPNSRAARALLCVLEPIGDVEMLSMTAEWFASMVEGLRGA
jgi:hypothetical protein